MSQKFQLNKDVRERAVVSANVIKLIQSLPATKVWVVEVKQYVKPRTLDQNAAAFGLAYKTIMESCGLEGERDREKLHSDFCGDFWGWTDKPIIGRVPVRTTTTNKAGKRDVIDTETMARFFDFIQRRALEYGIMVPDPDPLWNNERMKRQ